MLVSFLFYKISIVALIVVSESKFEKYCDVKRHRDNNWEHKSNFKDQSGQYFSEIKLKFKVLICSFFYFIFLFKIML